MYSRGRRCRLGELAGQGAAVPLERVGEAGQVGEIATRGIGHRAYGLRPAGASNPDRGAAADKPSLRGDQSGDGGASRSRIERIERTPAGRSENGHREDGDPTPERLQVEHSVSLRVS